MEEKPKSSALFRYDRCNASPLTFALSGIADAAVASDFYLNVESEYRAQPSDIVFLCNGMEYIDSTMLGTFVRLHKMARQDGHAIRFQGLNEHLKKLFRICALDKIMEIG